MRFASSHTICLAKTRAGSCVLTCNCRVSPTILSTTNVTPPNNLQSIISSLPILKIGQDLRIKFKKLLTTCDIC